MSIISQVALTCQEAAKDENVPGIVKEPDKRSIAFCRRKEAREKSLRRYDKNAETRTSNDGRTGCEIFFILCDEIKDSCLYCA